MSLPLVHVIRNGVVEGVHHASAVVVDAKGDIMWRAGEVHRQIFPRSANKLAQGLAMVRAGLPETGRLLALSCASHSGESIHVDGVHDILSAANLDVDALQCPPDLPMDPVERDTVLIEGGHAARVYMNCSGKHAAMLHTCVLNSWDTATYLDATHPLQQLCRTTLEECTGETVEHVGVDGCGAPLMSTSLVGLARMFAGFAGPGADAQRASISQSIRSYPEYLSGTRRDDCELMRGVPGLVAKIGAEGVYGIGLGDGRALALKVDDGADRARIVLAAAILRDVMDVVAHVVDTQSSLPLLGGGKPVGQVTAVLPR